MSLHLRELLPESSIFRIPLVFHLTWVLVLKLVLLSLLWLLGFKPLLDTQPIPLEQQLGFAGNQPSSSAPLPLKDVKHD